jgi:RimJ/RimL family protein N-acetyltransferase
MLTIKKADFISGFGLVLRNATVDDASFILSLRVNPKLNRYISPVSGGIHEQVEYLENYKKCSGQAFFVIETEDRVPIGTVRLYDQQGNSFCWGSWIIKPEAPLRAGTRSALLVYYYGFDFLGFERSHFDVRKDNEKVWKFHEKNGARLIYESGLDRYYSLSKIDWYDYKLKYRTDTDKSEISVQVDGQRFVV